MRIVSRWFLFIALSSTLFVSESFAQSDDAQTLTNKGRPAESPSGTRLDVATIRGQLPGMPLAERSNPRNIPVKGTNIWRDRFSEVQGDLADYGLGPVSASDPLPTKRATWSALSSAEREIEKSAVREKLLAAIASQSGNRDLRQIPISWKDVTFTNVRQRTLRRGVVFEHEFQFPSGILGLWVTGRLFVPQLALDRFARGERSAAVIYEHYHGGLQGVGTREIDTNWFYNGLGTPLDMLTELGVITITTDVHGFNRRRVVEARSNDEVADIQDELDDTERLFKVGMSRYGIRSMEDLAWV